MNRRDELGEDWARTAYEDTDDLDQMGSLTAIAFDGFKKGWDARETEVIGLLKDIESLKLEIENMEGDLREIDIDDSTRDV